MPFSLFLALKYFRPKRSFTSVITLISVLGMVLGVAIIIIVRAVMTGFGDMWQEKILAFKPHITITRYGREVIRDEGSVCARLEQIPGILAVAPSVELRVLAERRRRVEAPIVIGTDSARARRVMQVDRMVSGDFDLEGDAVVLGVDLANTLGVRTGDELFVYSPMNLVNKDEIYFPERLVVKGVFDSGQRDFDSGFLIVSLDVARDLLGMKEGVYSINLKCADPQKTSEFGRIVDDVRALFPGFNVQTWQEVDRTLFNALAVEKNMMALLLAFITVVAIFCVVNTLIVLTVQKTSEIGLLKALGFSSRQVMGVFVIHGWIQCVVGVALGIVAAFLVLHNLQTMVDGLAHLGVEVFPKDVYGLAQIPWRVTTMEVVQVAVLVVVFCTLASLVPACLAACKDPVRSLRNE
ncbi:MAG: ABC transporter permease [Kiritimatiellae bacterium]|nr:ABC transporter permease [Kiritimatiellia bacterium]